VPRTRLREKLLGKRPEATDAPVKVVVGLRNPGSDYDGTRHNVGSEVARALVERSGGSFRRGPSRVRAELAQVRLGDERVLVALPLSFMNESGGPVRSVLDYHRVGPGDMLVVHDDIDLDFGRLRIQEGGGTGGHNGLRSLERSLGTRDFTRLKVGVGRPPGRMDPAAYVLERFSRSQRPDVDLQVEDAAEVAERWVEDPRRAQELAAHRRPAER
jgi:peptidyl-tRNA hydrolase, PTH1 family